MLPLAPTRTGDSQSTSATILIYMTHSTKYLRCWNMVTRSNKVSQRMRVYSLTDELLSNCPYITMISLGAVVLFVGVSVRLWGLFAAGAYIIYGILGTLWIILFICPYCSYWGTRSCPCGYGRIASRLREKKTDSCFTDKFKKHIPVIVPLWFIPILVGVPFVIHNFSWLLLILLVLFAFDAFAVLPLFSTKHGCKECPQKDLCPWMGDKSRATN
jgi:hypothetical protein